MVKPGEPIDLITLRERAISNAAKIAALVAVLERKGILTPREVLDEIKRLRSDCGPAVATSRRAKGGPDSGDPTPTEERIGA